jgi:hypothetical protein
MRFGVLTISVVGVLAFAALFVLSYASPVTLEAWARVAIQHEIEKRASAVLQSLDQSALVRAAEKALGANNREIERTREALAELPARVARISAEMLDPKCPCRARAAELYKGSLAAKVARLTSVNERLTQLVQSKYAEVSQALLREFRIFTAANALVFACLGLVALFRRKAGLQLVLPAMVLLVAGVAVAYLYLFTQNWPQTVLLGDYVGLWYFPYLGLAVAFLSDIAFNRARVTTWLVNRMLEAVGSAATAVPC